MGSRQFRDSPPEGSIIGIDIQIADVKQALGSVRRMCEAGNRVVFDEEESYAENNETGKVLTFSQAGNEGPDETQPVRPESRRVEEMVAPIEEADEEYQEGAYKDALEHFDPNEEEEGGIQEEGGD